MASKSIRQAITLVELLVVMGIIGLLLSLLVPAIQNVRAAADKIACQSNMKQIGYATYLFYNDYGHVPKPAGNPANWQRDPVFMLSKLTYLTPYLEQSGILPEAVAACRTGIRPWFNPPHRGLATIIKVFSCPADSRLSEKLTDADGVPAAFGSYLTCSGAGEGRQHWGLFASTGAQGQGSNFAAVRDGLSNTIMLGERPPPDSLQAGRWYPVQANPLGKLKAVGPDDHMFMRNVSFFGDPCSGIFWYGPGRLDNPCDRWHFWSLHQRGAHFLFGDNSSRLIPYTTSRSVMAALATRAGGEVVELPD